MVNPSLICDPKVDGRTTTNVSHDSSLKVRKERTAKQKTKKKLPVSGVRLNYSLRLTHGTARSAAKNIREEENDEANFVGTAE